MKNKKPLIAIAALAIVGIIAGTIAFFTSSAEFPNIFHTKTYNTELTEEFKSPEDWAPGQDADKLVQVKNTGNIPLVARVSYTEEWVAADETTKPANTITVGEGENARTERTVILNGIDTAKWVQEKDSEGNVINENTYYYNEIINPNSPAVTFMNSVTFNPNVKIEYDEETVYTYALKTDETDKIEITVKNGAEMTDEQKASIENRVKVKEVKKYTSKEDGYAGATYTLTIKIETVQADREAVVATWGAAVADLLNITE